MRRIHKRRHSKRRVTHKRKCYGGETPLTKMGTAKRRLVFTNNNSAVNAASAKNNSRTPMRMGTAKRRLFGNTSNNEYLPEARIIGETINSPVKATVRETNINIAPKFAEKQQAIAKGKITMAPTAKSHAFITEAYRKPQTEVVELSENNVRFIKKKLGQRTAKNKLRNLLSPPPRNILANTAAAQ